MSSVPLSLLHQDLTLFFNALARKRSLYIIDGYFFSFLPAAGPEAGKAGGVAHPSHTCCQRKGRKLSVHWLRHLEEMHVRRAALALPARARQEGGGGLIGLLSALWRACDT